MNKQTDMETIRFQDLEQLKDIPTSTFLKDVDKSYSETMELILEDDISKLKEVAINAIIERNYLRSAVNYLKQNKDENK